MSAEIGLDDQVLFLGNRSQDTLPYYYSAAKAVVVPSHYEFFGMVALEAMACGTPVVASQVGGLAFLVQDNETGFHVPAGDAPALADRLRRLVEDEAPRTRLGRQAAEYARSYVLAAHRRPDPGSLRHAAQEACLRRGAPAPARRLARPLPRILPAVERIGGPERSREGDACPRVIRIPAARPDGGPGAAGRRRAEPPLGRARPRPACRPLLVYLAPDHGGWIGSRS